MSGEQKIRDLCDKISAVPEGSTEFWHYLVELRNVLQEHIAFLRGQTGDKQINQKKPLKTRRAS
jgi:hypothetical protein